MLIQRNLYIFTNFLYHGLPVGNSLGTSLDLNDLYFLMLERGL